MRTEVEAPGVEPRDVSGGVTVAAVGKAFGAVQALDGVSLRVAAREVVAVVGPARDAVAKSVEYVRSQIGEQAWEEGMHPVLEPAAEIENPYKYTEGTAKVKAQ